MTICTLEISLNFTKTLVVLILLYTVFDYGYISRFSNMQVSLFGEVFMAEATVVNNHLTVTTAGNVFGYPAEICIKAPSNIANWKTLPLTLEGSLLLGNNSFTQVLTDEIIEKLMMMGLEGNSRLQTAKLSLAQSEDRLNSISYQLNIAIENVTQANETKKAANNAVKAKKAQLLEVEVEFNNSRDVLQDLEEMLDEICTDQFCADICMPGESCRNCTIPTFVEKTSKCPITIQEKRSVRVPPFFETRTTWQRQIFDLRCAQVSNIQLFFMEIKAILMEVYASIEASLETTTLLSQILRNDDLSNNEEFEAYLDFIKKYEDLSVEALHALETTLFSEWQASMEFLYSESGSVGEISCDGFADCLQISLDEIQHLVGLTPTNELNEDFLSLLQDFSIAKQKVLELALFSNITIDEGLTRIDPIIEITSAYATDNYWCNEPPVITIHPPPQVNISRGGTLQLRCDAKSKLAVTYEWERDGNILTQFTANELIVPAIQQFDSANYTCFANNPVGRAESITTSVTVYELPQFYLLPESVVTYFGDGNGAWFACNATAWPYPGWRWFYRSTNDKDWIIIDGEETNELLIMTPQKENEGIYACEAYNYHGSIRSEAVTLTLLPFTVSQQQFPVEFSISLANPSCSLEELYDSLYSLIFEAIDGESSIIEDFNITEVEMGSYDVSLTLLSANVTTHYLNFMTFAEIANLALPHATSLRNSISFITNVLDGDIGSHICPQSNSSVIENSLIVGRLTYICSPEQRLNSDYLLCCKLNYNT